MGIFDKVKNLFTEEVDEEELIERRKPIKKEEPEEIHTEEKKVEIAPALKETAIQYDKDKEEHKEERRALYFSDDDFDDIPTVIHHEEKKETHGFRTVDPDFSDFKSSFTETKKEEKEVKKFKPSPIISPIYGVLDKNYNKEDIKVEEEEKKPSKMTVDEVRDKAFNTKKETKKKETKKEEPELDIFDELKEQEDKSINAKLEEEINDIKELQEDVPVEEQETTDRKIDNILEELNEIQELIPESNEESKEEPIEEGDLFNLIDSMYEKRDDEDDE